MTFPKFPGFWSCDILTVFRRSFGCLNDSMLNTKQEWGLHLPDARSIYKQGLEKEVKSGKMFKTHNLGAYMSGGKVLARGYKNKDRSIALFIGIWAHDARQFLTALWVFPSKSSFVTYFGAIACGSRWHARISRQIVTSICDIILWSDTTKRWLFRLECQYTITNYTLFFRFSRCEYYNLKRQFSYNVMLV